MLHPIFGTVDPSVAVRSRVETRILWHAAVNEVLHYIYLTSVNFPFIPTFLSAVTI